MECIDRLQRAELHQLLGPASSAVGSLAIYHFARPVCFQNLPQAMLPPELKDANALGIHRLRDGKPE